MGFRGSKRLEHTSSESYSAANWGLEEETKMSLAHIHSPAVDRDQVARRKLQAKLEAKQRRDLEHELQREFNTLDVKNQEEASMVLGSMFSDRQYRHLNVERTQANWLTCVTDGLRECLADGERDSPIHEALRLLPVDVVGYIALETAVHLLAESGGSADLGDMCIVIGTRLQDIVDTFTDKTGTDIKHALEQYKQSLQDGGIENTTLFQQNMGRVLLDIMIDSCEINFNDKVNRKVFFLGECGGKEMVRWSNEVSKAFGIEQTNLARFFSKLVQPIMYPMVCEPIRWTKMRRGGYFATQFPMIRPSTGDLAPGRKAVERIGVGKVKSALNCLGAVPWRLNLNVVHVAQEVFDRSLGITGLQEDDIEFVTKPSTSNNETDGEQYFARIKVRQENERLKKKKQEIASKKYDFRAKLKLAEYVEQYTDVFWFPHSVDFRGRAYPIPVVSYMGDDLSRGFLLFDEARALGEHGLFWLKVQLANHMGKDKVSFEERVAWVDENIERVVDSAREPISKLNPSEGKWWTKADNPWQALATCFEIEAALNCSDPAEYMCRLPVHQDGSCNGLQHYAALGRDKHGAKQVNLLPGDKPSDVYSLVMKQVVDTVKERAALARKQMPDLERTALEQTEYIARTGKMPEKDFEFGNLSEEELEEKKAKETNLFLVKLDGQITRKVVKQTVMTTVYGVTFVGSRLQLTKRLEEINEQNMRLARNAKPHGHVFSEEDIRMGSRELTKIVTAAIGENFQAASKIQEWFTECARKITAEKCPVQWISPVGLPISQSYTKEDKARAEKTTRGLEVKQFNGGEGIHKRKQVAAFPPNFVHSLDASHMMLTALKCHEEGLVFTAVHDSFWTHPSDIPKMSRILREEFVKLHKQPLLQNLLDDFGRMHPLIEFNQVPEIDPENQLDLDEVLSSRYFFN